MLKNLERARPANLATLQSTDKIHLLTVLKTEKKKNCEYGRYGRKRFFSMFYAIPDFKFSDVTARFCTLRDLGGTTMRK